MKVTDVMIDIETLGKQADAPILSIGAFAWNMDDPIKTEDFEDQERSFSISVSLQSSLDLGLRPDGETFEWWMIQSDEARHALLNSTVSIREALTLLFTWLTRLERHSPRFEGYVWAWPPSFDLSCIRFSHSRALPKGDIPWHRRMERDARTICAELGTNPVEAPAPKLIGAPEHVAAYDALAQAIVTQKAMKKLYGIR